MTEDLRLKPQVTKLIKPYLNKLESPCGRLILFPDIKACSLLTPDNIVMSVLCLLQLDDKTGTC